ncbi:MAG: ABA4-like family protein [Tabrizicola sp.]
MTPDSLFQLANPVALAGWLVLLVSPVAPRAAQVVSAMAIPLLLALAYTGLILAFWWEAPGGFGSLPEVQALFTHPHIALAGWVHYLAFDLFVGSWEVRTARAEGIPHWAVIPCLILTFLFGPAGLLAFAILRFTLVRKVLP